jgi:hypothetical protein
MNLRKKALGGLLLILFCSQLSADELSVDLQRACVKEQLSEHKGIKGHPLEASDFNEYCKCETIFVREKATKEQLTQIEKTQSGNPNWLKKLKSQASKICIEQKKPTST